MSSMMTGSSPSDAPVYTVSALPSTISSDAGFGAGASGSSSVAGGTESCAEDMFVDTVQPLLSCRPLPVSLIGSSTSAFERFKNVSTTVTS